MTGVILASFAFVWLLELVRSVMWFFLVVILACGLLPYFLSGYHPLRRTIEMLGSPLLRPIRRWLGPLGARLPFDLAPWAVAALLLLIDRFVLRQLVWWGILLNPTGFGLNTAWAGALRLLIYAYVFVVLLRVLLSWFRSPTYHPFVQWIRRLTDPALYWTRRLVPLRLGAFDLSPVVLLVALSFLDRVLLAALVQYSVLLGRGPGLP